MRRLLIAFSWLLLTTSIFLFTTINVEASVYCHPAHHHKIKKHHHRHHWMHCRCPVKHHRHHKRPCRRVVNCFNRCTDTVTQFRCSTDYAYHCGRNSAVVEVCHERSFVVYPVIAVPRTPCCGE